MRTYTHGLGELSHDGGFLTITVRSAVKEDAKPVAELIYLAALANARVCPLDVVFNRGREQVLEKVAWMFQNIEDNFNHHLRCLVAEIDGRVASSLFLNTAHNDSFKVWRSAFRGMGYGDLEMLSMGWRIRSYFRVKPSFRSDSLIIDNVATFPDFRRSGAVHSLFERARALAGEKGFPRMELECQVGNTPARKAYEKEGFVVAEVKTHPSWERIFGTPGVMAMRLDLDT